MVRTPCCDKTGVKKGTWTPEEDRKLITYVTKYGNWNWRQLPKYAGIARCGKSCRLRWLNYLRPNVKKGNYTKEEEDTIIRLQESLGNRWSVIATQLPGRTDNGIKNHWHTRLKKRLKQNSNTYKKAKETPKDRLIHNIETNQEGESKAKVNRQEQKSKLHGIPPILESSSSFTQSTSSSDLISSTITDITSIGTSTKMIQDNDEVHQTRPYAEPSGNFWTEPFLPDNFYDSYISNDFQATFPEPGYASIHSPFLDGEIILWS